jgi:hypothetical protein
MLFNNPASIQTGHLEKAGSFLLKTKIKTLNY